MCLSYVGVIVCVVCTFNEVEVGDTFICLGVICIGSRMVLSRSCICRKEYISFIERVGLCGGHDMMGERGGCR